MSDQTKKEYLPKTNIRTISSKYGEFYAVSMHVDTVTEWMKSHANEAGWVNFAIFKRRSPDEYGRTHYAIENEMPEGNKAKKPHPMDGRDGDEDTDDNIPR